MRKFIAGGLAFVAGCSQVTYTPPFSKPTAPAPVQPAPAPVVVAPKPVVVPPPSQLVSDTNLIASGLTALMPDMQAAPGVDANTVATDITNIQGNAGAVAMAPPNPAQVQAMVQTVQVLANVVMPLVSASNPGAALGIEAAVSLLPVLMQAISPPSQAVGIRAGFATTTTLKPPAARLILKGIIAQHAK
jgi:hypothetical protein